MNKFLKKCQKAFKNKNLILLYDKYPFDNSIIRDGCFLTKEQRFICNLIIEIGLPFVIEYKINAPEFNHFYIDILVKTKYHLISFEIDGPQHSTQKEQKIRDLKKAIYILKHRNIFTIRIKNERINNYLENPKIVNDALKFLNKRLCSKNNEAIYKAGLIGDMNKKIREVKSS